jgi:hypothetical protein
MLMAGPRLQILIDEERCRRVLAEARRSISTTAADLDRGLD